MADEDLEAQRLKTLAETKYKSSNLKSALKYAKRAHRLAPNFDGLSEMLTIFKILRSAAMSSADPDFYKILQVEPFAHANTIKKQYKRLALTLHPDKNPHVGSEEAFKIVDNAFRFLSDKIRRKEYDVKLRIRMQEKAVEEGGGGLGAAAVEAFWTACSRCRLLHQFERKYLGHNLVCPSCKKSFKAVEVGEENEEGSSSDLVVGRKASEEAGEWSGGRLRRRRMSSVGDVLERSMPKRAKTEEEMTMTLAEMQLEAKCKAKEKAKLRLNEKEKEKNELLKEKETNELVKEKTNELVKEKEKNELVKEKEKENEKLVKEKEKENEKLVKEKEKNERVKEKEKDELVKEKVKKWRLKEKEKSRDSQSDKRRAVKKGGNLEIERQGVSKKSRGSEIERQTSSKGGDLEIMAVEDSDFYNFDKDREERSFKKGQVWAIYDDDNGMPRHYGLIDEVVLVNPFEVKISWLDLQNNGDEGLICLEKMGFHVSCGRFKVARKTSINALNIFSHVVDCERVAREVYRIYPKKGSVWALYNESTWDAGGGNLSDKDNRSYDIVVFLTTYSEMHGLSMAYLEKVDGFKTIFKRRDVGVHSIRWLEKDDGRLFSHQIPARKLSGDEVPDHVKDCWELDPASLPSDLLTIC